MSETIGRLLAVGTVAEVFECGSRVLKLYRSAVRKPTTFREAAIHATVETMGLPVPAVWGVQEVGGRWGIVFDRISEASFAKRMQEDPSRTRVPGDTRPTARAHSYSPGSRARQSEVEAGSKHRAHRPSRRTEKTDFAQPPCRDAKRRPPLSRRFSPHQRLGPNLAALGDRLA